MAAEIVAESLEMVDYLTPSKGSTQQPTTTTEQNPSKLLTKHQQILNTLKKQSQAITENAEQFVNTLDFYTINRTSGAVLLASHIIAWVAPLYVIILVGSNTSTMWASAKKCNEYLSTTQGQTYSNNVQSWYNSNTDILTGNTLSIYNNGIDIPYNYSQTFDMCIDAIKLASATETETFYSCPVVFMSDQYKGDTPTYGSFIPSCAAGMSYIDRRSRWTIPLLVTFSIVLFIAVLDIVDTLVFWRRHVQTIWARHKLFEIKKTVEQLMEASAGNLDDVNANFIIKIASQRARKETSADIFEEAITEFTGTYAENVGRSRWVRLRFWWGHNFWLGGKHYYEYTMINEIMESALQYVACINGPSNIMSLNFVRMGLIAINCIFSPYAIYLAQNKFRKYGYMYVNIIDISIDVGYTVCGLLGFSGVFFELNSTNIFYVANSYNDKSDLYLALDVFCVIYPIFCLLLTINEMWNVLIMEHMEDLEKYDKEDDIEINVENGDGEKNIEINIENGDGEENKEDTTTTTTTTTTTNTNTNTNTNNTGNATNLIMSKESMQSIDATLSNYDEVRSRVEVMIEMRHLQNRHICKAVVENLIGITVIVFGIVLIFMLFFRNQDFFWNIGCEDIHTCSGDLLHCNSNDIGVTPIGQEWLNEIHDDGCKYDPKDYPFTLFPTDREFSQIGSSWKGMILFEYEQHNIMHQNYSTITAEGLVSLNITKTESMSYVTLSIRKPRICPGTLTDCLQPTNTAKEFRDVIFSNKHDAICTAKYYVACSTGVARHANTSTRMRSEWVNYTGIQSQTWMLDKEANENTNCVKSIDSQWNTDLHLASPASYPISGNYFYFNELQKQAEQTIGWTLELRRAVRTCQKGCQYISFEQAQDRMGSSVFGNNFRVQSHQMIVGRATPGGGKTDAECQLELRTRN